MLTIGASGMVALSTCLNAQPYVTGAGAKSCAEFVRQAGPAGLSNPIALQWALGYITGRATATHTYHQPFKGPEGIALDLLAYCRAHPIHQIDDAAAVFFERTRYCHTKHRCR